MQLSAKLNSRYEIQQILAKGGMGVVYKAFDKVMKRSVAVKTLLDLTDKAALQLFHKECEDLAFLAHPNIIEIFDIGEFDDGGISRPYLVMPLLPGVTLETLLRSGTERLSVERSVDIICQACRGLQAAHDKGLIHRDIKPSNLFVMDDDSVKIIDFGVAHRIETSRTVGRKGTLLYMAPEQIQMKPLSAVSDLFSLGVVCYEMLTGRQPFEQTTEDSVVSAILRFVPPLASAINPDVNAALSQAVHKAMAKQPWHRYASAKDFSETLQKALRNEHIDIFNPARIRPRLERAARAFEKNDFQFATEILDELEAEGHVDAGIVDLRRQIDSSVRAQSVARLLDAAHARMEEGEYPLALQKVNEVLQLDPAHAEALSLRETIESKRINADIRDGLAVARRQMDESAFGQARQTLKRILQLRPDDPDAVRLLDEVKRIQQEHTRIREEKERHFEAAIKADERGDIASAMRSLEQLLELDRRSPDPNSGRGTAYLSLYDRVRAQHEAVAEAFEETKRQLALSNFSEALSICKTQLARFPGHALFQVLKNEAEEQQRRAIAATIAAIDRKWELEPDLERRVAILEEALRDYPGEPHFEQLLQRTREKRALVESIVARARMHEAQAQFGEALSQWEAVQSSYGRYPGLTAEIERLSQKWQQHLQLEAKIERVEHIDGLLQSRQYGRAMEVLAKAHEEFPADSELAQREQLARRGVERAAEIDNLLSRSREEFNLGRYEAGLETLRQAYELDRGNPRVRLAFLDGLIDAARSSLERDPTSSERYLRQALELEPQHEFARELIGVLQRKRQSQEQSLPAPKPLDQSPDPQHPPAKPLEAPSRIQTAALWKRVVAVVGGRPKAWAAAALAGLILFVLILIAIRKPSSNVDSGSARLAGVEVTTVPTGALIRVNGKDRGSSAQPLRLELPVGPIEVEASLPGYRSVSKKLNLAASDRSFLALTLEPVLTLKLLCSRTAQVKVNDEEAQPLRDGEFVRQFPIGEYTIKLTAGRTANLSFTFKVVPDGPAIITSPPRARDLSTLLVSHFGEQGSLHTSGPPVKVKLDGEQLGELGPKGMTLPSLGAANHPLELGEGSDLRKRMLEFGPDRTLTAIVESDPDTGTLSVETNEDGVTISIVSGKDAVQSGATSAGRFRVDLRAKTYTVQAAKQGYEADKAEQRVEIRKREDQTIRFNFRQKPAIVSFRIRSSPGAEIFVDGNLAGTASADGMYTVNGLKPGPHIFRAEKGRAFQANEKRADVAERQSELLDLQLLIKPATIEIRKNPPDSFVTYTRPENSSVVTFEGTKGSLAPGEYTFRARAKGYDDKFATTNVAVDNNTILDLTQVRERSVAALPTALTIADWGPGIWRLDNGWHQRSAAGRIFFPRALATGILEYSIRWDGKGRVQWYLNYVDDKNYLLCDLSENSFQVDRFVQGQRAKAPVIKTSIGKQDSYTIRIRLRQDGIAPELLVGKDWKPLGTAPGPPAPAGKFGLLIPSGQTVFLANFKYQPDR